MNRLFGVFALLATSTACHNACQNICFDMAEYAEDECGLVVSDGQLDACLEAQAGANSKEDRKECRQGSGQNAIAEAFTCDDLRDYFEAED